ncbi:type VI secretion system amidase effector protein Tae4 [Proteus cibi]|uniref:Type VI secretion system amidase effector protein Tae4 n=1 Tax=Proteus cibi TaxID=2050966 RepID=A0ABU6EHN3_9GAMM|nr:T6SS effector amidase Tae4 family protein [Proteus cibi]MEB6858591.1 type VI secretion system amidase effector protein Tae4 [Proteus cibi]MEB7089986.1 type VI secretion system amidase effector protein Tae4 [Proteus cibi]
MPNKETTAKTNGNSNSIKTLSLNVLQFEQLWDAYPSSTIEHQDPKTRDDVFSDHCAIHVSEALYQCGILMRSFHGTRCWHCPTPDDKTKKGIHAIRAQELSHYLQNQPFAGCPKAIELTGSSYESVISDKTGIIFFQDYWLRAGEKTATGDHIDLWNKGELAGSGTIGSFFRVTFPNFTESFTDLFGSNARVTSLEKAKKVLFWEIL